MSIKCYLFDGVIHSNTLLSWSRVPHFHVGQQHYTVRLTRYLFKGSNWSLGLWRKSIFDQSHSKSRYRVSRHKNKKCMYLQSIVCTVWTKKPHSARQRQGHPLPLSTLSSPLFVSLSFCLMQGLRTCYRRRLWRYSRWFPSLFLLMFVCLSFHHWKEFLLAFHLLLGRSSLYLFWLPPLRLWLCFFVGILFRLSSVTKICRVCFTSRHLKDLSSLEISLDLPQHSRILTFTFT